MAATVSANRFTRITPIRVANRRAISVNQRFRKGVGGMGLATNSAQIIAKAKILHPELCSPTHKGA